MRQQIRIFLGLFLIAFWTIPTAFAQQKKPTPPPKIENLTVDPTTGFPTITWTAPPPSTEYDPPAGYILYRQINGLFEPLVGPRTSNPPIPFGETEYTEKLPLGLRGQVKYKIASITPSDPGYDSMISEPTSSMFLTADYDGCEGIINLNWEPYKGWDNDFGEIVVYSGADSNWQNLLGKAHLDRYSKEWTTNNVPPNKKLYFYVELSRKSNPSLVTRSNIVEVTTKSDRRTALLHIESIIGAPKSNTIKFQITPGDQTKHYLLLRQEGNRNTVTGRNGATVVEQFSDPNITQIVDTKDPDKIQSTKKYYYLVAVDDCDQEVDQSNVLNSIIIRARSDKSINTVRWDNLEVAPGNSVEYNLVRTSVNQGTKLEDQLITKGSEDPLIYEDDISEFESRGFESLFCYRVEAWEVHLGIRTHQVVSAPACTAPEPSVKIPNAIVPTSTGNPNPLGTTNRARNEFAPITSFEADYTLTIFNQAGAVVFRGINEPWKGVLSNGTYAHEGAYIYSIEVRPKQGDYQSKTFTGSFMVLYPKN